VEKIMAKKEKNKPAVKKSSAIMTKPANSKKAKPAWDEKAEAAITVMENQYPGITEQFRHFDSAELPPCPHCRSKNTASVQVGIIGRTIHLAAYSKKFKLVPNGSDKEGKYFCNKCKKFFD
jgi:hypothetical protein